MSSALAAEGHFQPVLPDFPSFSAACLAPAKLRPGKNHGSASSRFSISYCSATHQNGEIVNHCNGFYFEEDSQFKAGSAAVFRINEATPGQYPL